MENGKQERRQYATEAIELERNGREYSEVLKKIKSKVRVEDIGHHVKTIRSSREGKLLIEMQLLKENIKDLSTKRFTNEKRSLVHIHDMDKTTNANELVIAIESKGVVVKSFRPYRNDRQAATVELEEEAANILKMRKIRVGCVLASVQARVKIDVCYNCRKICHLAKNCISKMMQNCR